MTAEPAGICATCKGQGFVPARLPALLAAQGLGFPPGPRIDACPTCATEARLLWEAHENFRARIEREDALRAAQPITQPTRRSKTDGRASRAAA